MTEKTLVIPLTNIRDIKMRFVKVNDHQWQCLASDEFLKDMEIFFKDGYDELDTIRQVELIENESRA